MLFNQLILYSYDQVFMSHVTLENQVFFFIHLKSKENFSDISATKKYQIDEELVVTLQYKSDPLFTRSPDSN